MKEALLSHGGVNGVRVAVLPTIQETPQHQGKIPGISKLNNFQYCGESLLAWRTYRIGVGKFFVLDKVKGTLFSMTEYTNVDDDDDDICMISVRQISILLNTYYWLFDLIYSCFLPVKNFFTM